MAVTSSGDANGQLHRQVPQWTPHILAIHLFCIAKLLLVSGLDEAPAQVDLDRAAQRC